MSQKLFTHFWRIFVAKTIYRLYLESFCPLYSADRKVLNFCVSAIDTMYEYYECYECYEYYEF